MCLHGKDTQAVEFSVSTLPAKRTNTKTKMVLAWGDHRRDARRLRGDHAMRAARVGPLQQVATYRCEQLSTCTIDRPRTSESRYRVFTVETSALRMHDVEPPLDTHYKRLQRVHYHALLRRYIRWRENRTASTVPCPTHTHWQKRSIKKPLKRSTAMKRRLIFTGFVARTAP